MQFWYRVLSEKNVLKLNQFAKSEDWFSSRLSLLKYYYGIRGSTIFGSLISSLFIHVYSIKTKYYDTLILNITFQ